MILSKKIEARVTLVIRTLPASVRQIEAFSGVASGRLMVGSTPMLPELFADEPLSLAARERVQEGNAADV